MKPKDYNKKRKILKEEKREISKTSFENSNIRKTKVNDINRSFRSLKRSEKQIIQKEINDDIISRENDDIDYHKTFDMSDYD